MVYQPLGFHAYNQLISVEIDLFLVSNYFYHEIIAFSGSFIEIYLFPSANLGLQSVEIREKSIFFIRADLKTICEFANTATNLALKSSSFASFNKVI